METSRFENHAVLVLDCTLALRAYERKPRTLRSRCSKGSEINSSYATDGEYRDIMLRDQCQLTGQAFMYMWGQQEHVV